MKLCKDCVFNSPAHCCNRLMHVRQDPVTGKMKEFGKTLFCSEEREHGIIASYLLGHCGKSARYFKRKE